ncbi:MAG: site-specific integrase, partial [Pseudomonadota bacterium]
MSIVISPQARDMLDAYLAHQSALKGAAANTLTAYGTDIREFLVFMTEHQAAPQGLSALRQITTPDMRAWMAR